MTTEEQERFENELGRVKPASLPPEFMDRLRALKPEARPAASQPEPRRVSGLAELFLRLRWIIAAAPVVVAVMLLVRSESRPVGGAAKISPPVVTGIKANAVQVDHALVSSFDAVAELPGGEPVRFRCRQWRDNLVMSDPTHGLVIEQSTPRLEVTPVRFETY